MKRLTSQELKEIKGGASITGSLLNAFVDILKVLLDAGRSVGSELLAIRYVRQTCKRVSHYIYGFGNFNSFTNRIFFWTSSRNQFITIVLSNFYF